ncbi:MAG TPA: Ku protein [Syntrophales bacterium]|nr:Ku protein [Syntrophales bacterium]
MKAIWKGHIRFSLVTIPILVYSAVDTEQTISFNLLHKKDHGRINYDKRCSKCNKIVSLEDIVKGYKYEPEQYVIVEKEDLEKINLKSTKILEIQGFIDTKDVHPALYDTPYYAGPDGPVAVKAYSLLAAALKETGKVAVGKVVLHERENVVVIAPDKNALVLYKLRSPEELRDVNDIPELDTQPLGKEELKLARSLVDSMTTTIDNIDMKDKYHDALREMIHAKIEGKEIITVEEKERPVVDIMTALKKSIEQAKMQKKSGGKSKAAAGKGKKTQAAILDFPRKGAL